MRSTYLHLFIWSWGIYPRFERKLRSWGSVYYCFMCQLLCFIVIFIESSSVFRLLWKKYVGIGR